MQIPCPGTKDEIYQKLKDKLEKLKNEGKLAQVKELKFEDSLKKVVASGTGFDSEIRCENQSIIVDLNLSFLLKPMRSQIEESIKKSVLKALS